MRQNDPDDVWIDVVSPSFASGETGQFFAIATLHHPYGMHGPAEARVRFNLSGYIRHEIAKASGLSDDRSQADATEVAR